MTIMAELTRDTFFQGRLIVTQSREGYRFSIDAVLLAAVVGLKPGETALDLGTGCGIIPLILACRYPHARIHAIEVQSELAELAKKNVADNQMEDRIVVACADLRTMNGIAHAAPFDWVVSNPPYHRARGGRINPNNQRALARHEIMVDLQHLLACSRRTLRTGGRFAIIYTADRLTDLMVGMRQAGIEPKWVRAVHAGRGEEAKLVLVKGTMAGRPGMQIARPLIIYQPDGRYSDEVAAMMAP